MANLPWELIELNEVASRSEEWARRVVMVGKMPAYDCFTSKIDRLKSDLSGDDS
jgi:hypothetical protein